MSSVTAHSPARILDLACGSGDVATLLLQSLPSAQVVGLDFCRPLLQQAQVRGVAQLIEGDALHLPFSDGTFDIVTLAFGLRNFADRPRALREIARVLRTGGHFALLEFSPPPFPWKLFWDFYLFYFMPAVAQLLTRQGESFRYLARSISAFPSPENLRLELESVGLKAVSVRSMSAGLVKLNLSTLK